MKIINNKEEGIEKRFQMIKRMREIFQILTYLPCIQPTLFIHMVL